jgi:hypothetical protein
MVIEPLLEDTLPKHEWKQYRASAEKKKKIE